MPVLAFRGNERLGDRSWIGHWRHSHDRYIATLAASGLSLIANTAPMAYGALGTLIAGLASVIGLDPYLLGAMVGRQLPFFSLIVPFWLIWVFASWRGMMQIWPAILVTGVSFAIPQFLISNYVNPWIVDVGASLILFLRV